MTHPRVLSAAAILVLIGTGVLFRAPDRARAQGAETAVSDAGVSQRNRPSKEGDGDVPRRFRGTYDELSGLLDDFERHLDGQPARGRDPIFGGELLPANSHRGEGLLKADALKGCLMYAQRLKALGAGGVSVQMAYPLLTDDFPRSAEYWRFYAELARGLKGMGLKLHVKSGPIFTEKEFSSVDTDYSKVTADSYFAARMRIAQRIAEEIRPDYLSIGNEPSSEMKIFKFNVTSDRYTRFINDTLRGMKRTGVAVGAGSGTWDSLDYIRRFASDTDLDFIDLHIYPIASPRDNFLRRAVEMAEVARASRKRIIIGEAWLYKAGKRELTASPTAAKIFARDALSYWAPLDSRFLEVMQKFARTQQVEYVSPFWTKYLFAYVGPRETPIFGTPKALLQAGDRAMLKALLAGQYSETGEAYRRIAGR